MRIETQIGPQGEVVRISGPAPELPLVAKRDLEQAWEIAQAGGVAPPSGGQVFRFGGAEAVEVVVADPDASAWVAALERRIGFGSAHGVSVCLRLLALVALMARAEWARDWFVLERGGAKIRPELLQAAALVRLNDAGGFDETALRALLPAPARRDAVE